MSSRHKKSLEVGKNLANYLSKNYSVSVDEFKRGLNKLERELIKKESKSNYQKEIKRRCAELFCSFCLEKHIDWSMTKNALRKLDTLGYTNIERRGHFAILLCKYAENISQAKNAAKLRAADTLRRVKCLKKDNILRKNYENHLLKYA